MANKTQTTRTLTEFPRDFDESENIIGKLVDRVDKFLSNYGGPKVDSNDLSKVTEEEVGGDGESAAAINSGNLNNFLSYLPTKPETTTKSDVNKNVSDAGDDNRSNETSVNSLASSLIEFATMKDSSLRTYKNTDLHRFWMSDEGAKQCYDCAQKFTSFRRKHHCRLCGQIFCSKCCNQVVSGKIIMCSGDLKVCVYCSKTVLKHLKASNVKSNLKADLDECEEGLSNNLSLQDSPLPGISSESMKFNSLTGYEEEQFLTNTNSLPREDRKNILKQSNSLKALYEEMREIMPQENRGTDLLRFLLATGKFTNNVQAIEVINALAAAGFLIPIAEDSENANFEGTLQYQLLEKGEIKNISGDPKINLNLSENLMKGVLSGTELAGDPQGSGLYSLKSQLERARQLVKSYCVQEEFLTTELLKREGLDQSWSDILIPLCAKVAHEFRPTFTEQHFMDIRNYVNFKKIEGGSKQDCCIKGGVVFTKNVAHKAMMSHMKYPRVLLLQCAIVFERFERKYISMETLLLQEKEYLRNVVGRILNLKPNIVVVQKGMAGIAQQMLRSYGITLVLHVKPAVMEKLARCMECDIINSIESNIKTPRLGTCDLFFTKQFLDNCGRTKTLMGFEVYASPRNYAFLLRGGMSDELIRVKRVASILLYARHSWRFEMAFLLDIFAQRPPKILISSLKKFFLSNEDLRANENYQVSATGRTSAVSKLSTNSSMHANDEQSKSTTNLIFTSRDYTNNLADFRAFGGKHKKNGKLLKKKQPITQTSALTNHSGKISFDMRSYQHIPVLFCCFYYNPKAASSFCVEPTLLEMSFYGQNDIMLGQFLERYCFRSYICQSCNLPMTDHVRRYVHSSGCIQVSLSADSGKIESDEILVSSRCTTCNESTPPMPISQDTWCLSFGKYLELRFYNHYLPSCFKEVSLDKSSDSELDISKDKCTHSLQQNYVHYFHNNGFGVRFVYTPIEVWDICVPLLNISLKLDIKFEATKFMEATKELSIKGHNIYLKIQDRIIETTIDGDMELRAKLASVLNRDKSLFRRSIEVLENLLTAEICSHCDVNDGLINARRALAESIDLWGSRLNCTSTETGHHSKGPSELAVFSDHTYQDNVETSFDSSQAEKQNITVWKESRDQKEVSSTEPTDSKRTIEIREYESEKINIRKLLNLLLPNVNQQCWIQYPFDTTEHYTLPVGIIPIAVNEQDFTSIAAYCLTQNEYWKYIENIENPSDTPNSPKKRNSSHNSSIETDEKRTDDEKKANKSKPHFEFSFQDATTQFLCKIYFAREFDALRNKIFNSNKTEPLKIRSSFARSLSTSIPWDARGGKSGLKFRKTWDDRFIIKEMTKGDVASFENFAPNYFDHMTTCIVNQQTTLLNKIIGVFKVSVKKKEPIHEKSFLVMENLFYRLEIKEKFDLKGSERNRHVNPENHDGEIVLLDENLIKMSWSKPLYVQSSSKAQLRQAIDVDSSFLERNSIIDYSLLVGLNNQNGTLTLGIIDYIRTYTLDKRLESFVKQSGLLGGQGKLPTVIAPQRYKQRFTEAMERYFLAVPNRYS